MNKILIPIRDEPKSSKDSEVSVTTLLNWISESGYWSGMDDDIYFKNASLTKVLHEFKDKLEDGRVIVGTGKTMNTLKLTLLDEDVGKLFMDSVVTDGLATDSNVTIIIRYEEGFEGLGSLFGDPATENPMSQKTVDSFSNMIWFRHSCWDKKVFSKPEAWITGFLKTESE